MSLNEEVELLRRIPLFAKIEPSKLKLLAFTSQRLTYKPGDVLCRQGDPGDAAFVIVNGEADVSVDTPSGPLTVAHLKQNDFVGEIAILCEVPRTATVAAVTEVTTLRIEKDRSEEHSSELQSLMRISYAVFCLKTKTKNKKTS